MSTTIVTRSSKGGRLSFTDMDNNLLNLKATADVAAPQVTTYTKTQVDTAIASATPSFATLTGKPTTIAGYGITDGMTAAAISTAIGVETTRATAVEALKAPLTSPTLVTPNIGVATGTSLSLSGDMNITGNVYISGTATTISSTNLTISDPMIYLGQGNTGNVSDIGIIGSINPGTEQHTGFVKDATDGVWKLFSDVVPEPTGTVDFTSATYDALKVGSVTATTFTGALSGNATTATNVAYSGLTGTAPTWNQNTTGTAAGLSATLAVTSGGTGVTTSTGTGSNVLSGSPTFTGTVSGITAAMVGAQVAGNYALLSGATFTGDVVAPNFNSNSDRNLKDNIIKIETASEIISHLEGVSFTWKDTGVKTFGFIAQEVEEIIPELIGKNDELGTLTVNYQGIIPFLVEALKEQAARIAALESK